MGQYWHICDLNTMHSIPNSKWGGAKLGEFFFAEHESLEKLLEGGLFHGRKYLPLNLTAVASTESQSSRLLAFPNEILIAILLSVEDQVDRLCFGLTCVKLFSICEDNWLRHYTDSFLRPRLLCVGDYAEWLSIGDQCMEAFKSLHLRPSVLAEQQEFRSDEYMQSTTPYYAISSLYTLPDVTPNDDQTNPLSSSLRQLGFKVWQRIIPKTSSEELRSLFAAISPEKIKDISNFSAYPEAFAIQRSLIFARTTAAMPSALENQPRVLCNITKRLFVLEEPMYTALKKAAQRTDLPTLGHVVLSQICRSDEGDWTLPSVSIEGPWAGDELEIVPELVFLERLQSLDLAAVRKWRNETGKILDLLWGLIEVYSNHSGAGASKNAEQKRALDRQFKPGKTAEEILEERFP